MVSINAGAISYNEVYAEEYMVIWRIWETGFRGETNRTSHYDKAELHSDKAAKVRSRKDVMPAGIKSRLVAKAYLLVD